MDPFAVRISKSVLKMYILINLGSVYTAPDPFRIDTKLVRIRLVFTRDRSGSGTDRICYRYQGALMKVIPYGTVPFQFRTGPV